MIRHFAFHDAKYNQDFVVWAADELEAWYHLYCQNEEWAATCVTFLREVSYEEQKEMKQSY